MAKGERSAGAGWSLKKTPGEGKRTYKRGLINVHPGRPRSRELRPLSTTRRSSEKLRVTRIIETVTLPMPLEISRLKPPANSKRAALSSIQFNEESLISREEAASEQTPINRLLSTAAVYPPSRLWRYPRYLFFDKQQSTSSGRLCTVSPRCCAQRWLRASGRDSRTVELMNRRGKVSRALGNHCVDSCSGSR